MPFIESHSTAGLSEAWKRQLIRQIVEVTHEAIDSDPKIINVGLHEHPAVNLSVSGLIEREIAANMAVRRRAIEIPLSIQSGGSGTSSAEPKRAAKEIAMAEHLTAATCGVEHVGLSVRNLESTRRFFCDCLGWQVIGERPHYPAAFVSDGHDIVTLWQVEAPDRAVAFDRRTNVGLHHLALAVADRVGLDALYERVASWSGVVVEFAPQPSGKGPKIHFIVREPSGVRIEFAFDPRVERSR
jgi:catechol 2,3-dioxygenase-like lactoylglutathione lyase family enzyme/phenylpyruvate tautomerase PptA (4-oxalocrotonate tautomerase family)